MYIELFFLSVSLLCLCSQTKTEHPQPSLGKEEPFSLYTQQTITFPLQRAKDLNLGFTLL